LPDKPQNQTHKTVTAQEFNIGDFKTNGSSAINMWLTDGDTKGIHKIKLFINDSLADSREFLID
jgi:hypothetical protein